jgi:hypothetical protein
VPPRPHHSDPASSPKAKDSSERLSVAEDSLAAAVDPDIGYLVYGAIVCSGDVPPGSYLRFTDEWGVRLEAPIAARTSYAISGLHTGKWSRTVHDCPGYYAPPLACTLADQSILRLDLELSPAPSIAIYLHLPDGSPPATLFGKDHLKGWFIPEIEIVATLEPLPAKVTAEHLARFGRGKYTPAKEAGRSGHAQVPHGASGVLQLDCSPPAIASAVLGGRLLASASIDAETRELSLVVEPERLLGMLGSLRFRVLDASTGQPPRAFGVQISDHPTAQLMNPVMHGPADEGLFERPRLPPGKYELQIRAAGFEHVLRSFAIESGRTTDLGDIVLMEGGVIRGNVHNEAGGGVRVGLGWRLLDADPEAPFIKFGESTSEGAFAIAELPARSLLLGIVDPEWASDPLLVPPHPSPGTQLELVARRGVQVTLRQRSGGERPIQLVLRRKDGIVVWSARESGASTHSIRLIPGEYMLEMNSEDGVLESRLIAVSKDVVIDCSL